MKNKKICLITSSRADYWVMLPLIKYLSASKNFSFKLIVTGSHFYKKFGNSVNFINRDKLRNIKYLKILKNFQNKDYVTDSISLGLKKFNKYFKKTKPDIVCLPCDRFEILGPALSAFFNNIPIAHFHGGETSLGSQDETTRHCLTKISTIHFTSNEIHRKRVVQLGENPSNVHNVGNLSCENISKTNLLNKKQLEKKLKIKFDKKSILFTYHPITNDPQTTRKELDHILKALQKLKKINFFITLPNIDRGREDVIKYINKLSKYKNLTVKIFNTLGSVLYYSLIKSVNCVIGNSSSGLVEVPFLGTESIIIGIRQKGRFSEKGVQHINADQKKIFLTIKKILKEKKRKKKIKNSLATSKKIGNILKNFNQKNNLKKFYDINFKY